MTGRAGLVCVDSVRFGGAAMFFSPERTLVAGTSTAENLLTTPTLRYCAQFRCTRATQCCSLRQAASSIELLNTAKAALSIELRANYRITEKSIGLEGLSPPMALSLAIIWLTISANRSLNQASSKQFVMSTQACAFLEQLVDASSEWTKKLLDEFRGHLQRWPEQQPAQHRQAPQPLGSALDTNENWHARRDQGRLSQETGPLLAALSLPLTRQKRLCNSFSSLFPVLEPETRRRTLSPSPRATD